MSFFTAVRFLSPNSDLLPFAQGLNYRLKVVPDDLGLVFSHCESANIGNYGSKSTDNKIKSFVKNYCLPKSPKKMSYLIRSLIALLIFMRRIILSFNRSWSKIDWILISTMHFYAKLIFFKLYLIKCVSIIVFLIL